MRKTLLLTIVFITTIGLIYAFGGDGTDQQESASYGINPVLAQKLNAAEEAVNSDKIQSDEIKSKDLSAEYQAKLAAEEAKEAALEAERIAAEKELAEAKAKWEAAQESVEETEVKSREEKHFEQLSLSKSNGPNDPIVILDDGCTEDSIQIVIYTDSYYSDNSWKLYYHESTVLVASGAPTQSNTVHEWQICADADSCYDFFIYDTYCDGIYDPGYCEVYLNGTLYGLTGGEEFCELNFTLGGAEGCCTPPTGACCYDEECLGVMLQASCDTLEGTWYYEMECSEVNCPPLEDWNCNDNPPLGKTAGGNIDTEPNNSHTTAVTIESEYAYCGSIDAYDDYDWYVITMPSGSEDDFYCLNLQVLANDTPYQYAYDQGLDPLVVVYDSDGQTVLFSNYDNYGEWPDAVQNDCQVDSDYNDNCFPSGKVLYISIETESSVYLGSYYLITGVTACYPPTGRCCDYSEDAQNPTCDDDVYEIYCQGEDMIWAEGLNCTDNPCPTVPENDSCVNATPISEGTFYTNTEFATSEWIGSHSIGYEVWYCYTPTASGQTVVDLCGSSFNTRLAVWEGCECPPSVELAYDDNSCEENTGSYLQFWAEAEQSYLIQVGGWYTYGDVVMEVTSLADETGACCYGDLTNPSCVDGITESECYSTYDGHTFSMYSSCTDDPSPCRIYNYGDNCMIPFEIPSLPYTITNATNCGSGNDYESTCLNYYDAGEDIMYQFTLEEAMEVLIEFDPKTTSYTGILLDDNCPPDESGCIDWERDWNTDPRTIQTALSEGTYYIMIDRWSEDACIDSFDLYIGPPPIGRCCYIDEDIYNPACIDSIYESDCDEYDGEWTEGLNCTDDPCVGQIDCSNPIQITLPPDGGNWPIVDVNSTEGRNDNYSGTCLESYDAGQDILYELTVTEEVTVNINVASDQGMIGMALDDACPPGNFCLDYAETWTDDGLYFFNKTLSPGTYYLMIDNWPNPTYIEEFTLTIDLPNPPANDDCENAEYIEGPYPVTGTGTTIEASEDCMGWNGVWYTFDLPYEVNHVTFTVCGESNYLYSAGWILVDDCNCENYVSRDHHTWLEDECESGWGGIQFEFHDLPAGTYYWPAYFSYENGQGIDFSYTIEVEEFTPPSNDLCEDAIEISIPSSTLGYTYGATVDDVPDNYCGVSVLGDGVWYKLTGTGNRLTATTCNDVTDFDTEISVFCAGCYDLVCNGGNNDDEDSCTYAITNSTFSWCTEDGTEYLILVHNWGPETLPGDFQLDITDNGTSCSDAVDCTAPLGRCCYGDVYDRQCTDYITRKDCLTEYSGDSWVAGANCSDDPCDLAAEFNVDPDSVFGSVDDAGPGNVVNQTISVSNTGSDTLEFSADVFIDPLPVSSDLSLTERTDLSGNFGSIEKQKYAEREADDEQPVITDIFDFDGSEDFSSGFNNFTNYSNEMESTTVNWTYESLDGNPPGCAYHSYNASYYENDYLISNGPYPVPDEDNIALIWDQMVLWTTSYVLQRVGVSTNFDMDPADATWDWLYSGYGSGSSGWEQLSTSLEDYRGQEINIAFNYQGMEGSLWYIDNIEIATVAPPTGHCCYGDEYEPECVDEVTLDSCTSFYSGDWTQGSTCADDPCPYTPRCSENSLYGQSPELDDWGGMSSDAAMNMIRYDSYAGAYGTIEEVYFWGFDKYYSSYMWSECDEEPMDFEIKFYEDNDGVPGDAVYSETFTIEPEPITWDLDSILKEYHATLTTAVTLYEGWISIQGTSENTSDCYFLWASSFEGDEASLFDNLGDITTETLDLSFCLLGTAEDIWLSIDNTEGTIDPGDPAVDITVTLDASDLSCENVYSGKIKFATNDPLKSTVNVPVVFEVCVQHGYEYLPGDANMAAETWPAQTIGGDVTYLVNYFRGLADPCKLDGFYASADANGDCLVVGGDVTYLVNYFRGLADLSNCADYEPAWPTPSDVPADAPDGWPNCDDATIILEDKTSNSSSANQ